MLNRELFTQSVLDWQSWKESKNSKLLQRALLNIESAISMTPENSEFWFLQGILYSELKGNRLAQERALSSFIRCIELEPAHGRGQLMTGVKLLELGKFDLAITQYQYLLQKDKKMITGGNITALAMAYIGAKNEKQGVVYFENLALKMPAQADIIITLAVLNKACNNFEKAKKLLKNIISTNTGSKRNQAYATQLLVKWEAK